MVPRILTALAALLAATVMYSVGLLAGGSALLGSVMTLMLVLAATGPERALLIVAAFAPMGGALAALTASRASWAEPLAMAVVTGWLLRRVVVRQPWDPWPTALAAVMAGVVIASIGVQMYVTYDTIAPPGLTFGRAVFDWMVHNSRLPAEPSDLQVVAATRLLVALGLFSMATAVAAAAHPATVGAIVRVMTIGIAAVAALSLNRFVELVMRRGESFAATALELQRYVRVSSTIPDLNAASALFVLALPLAIFLAWGARARAAWMAAAAVLGAGIWLTGSRAGLLMGVLALVASVLLVAARLWTWTRTAVVMGLLGVAIAGAAAWYPRTEAHSASVDAWEIRKQLVITGVNMTRERPAWGVGVGRFYPESARFGSPALHRYYLAENAHNQFVQILGELGLVGVTLFLALVVTAAAPAARSLAGRGHRRVADAAARRRRRAAGGEPADAPVADTGGVVHLLAVAGPAARETATAVGLAAGRRRAVRHSRCGDRVDDTGPRRVRPPHARPGFDRRRPVRLAPRPSGRAALSNRHGTRYRLRRQPKAPPATVAPNRGIGPIGYANARAHCLEWPRGRCDSGPE